MENLFDQELIKKVAVMKKEVFDNERLLSIYPYLYEFLELINEEFPEIIISLGKENFNEIVIKRYKEAFGIFLYNNSMGNLDEEQSIELFLSILFKDLNKSYFYVIIEIIEEDFPHIFNEMEKLSYLDKKTIYSEFASSVYQNINGNNIFTRFYISPYMKGFDENERSYIKETLNNILENCSNSNIGKIILKN